METFITIANMATILGMFFWIRSDTKSDIQEIRNEMRADIQQVRAEMKADIQEVRAEMRADIQEIRADIKADRDLFQTQAIADRDVLINMLTEIRKQGTDTQNRVCFLEGSTNFGEELPKVTRRKRRSKAQNVDPKDILAAVSA